MPTEAVPTTSLHSLQREFLSYLEVIETSLGVIDEETEKRLVEIETALAQKVDAYDFVLARLEAEATVFSDQAKRLAGYSKACLNAAERLEERLKDVLRDQPNGVLEGEFAAFKLASTAGSVVITDPKAVPAAYKRVETVEIIEKARIKEDLKAGIPVPGAALQPGTMARRVRPKGMK